MLSDSALVGTVLDTACLQPDALPVCTALSCLLGFFQRDKVPPPNFLLTLQHKPTELKQLAQICSNLIRNPNHSMTTLSALLLEELSSRPNADLLFFIAATLADLLKKVAPGTIQELGQELIVVSRDPVGEERLRKLQEHYIRDKLEQLNATETVSLQTLEQLMSPQLVQVTDSILCFFHFQGSAWGPQVRLKTKIQADCYSSWVILRDGSVLCCGGLGTAAAYILARDGSVEQKANMTTKRWRHGLLATNTAYVFGGLCSATYLNTCEKLELPDNKWTLLPSMREARRDFNPCMLFGIVYLCGCFLMEAFVPETDTFLPLQIRLPEAQQCCLYADNNLLVLHFNSCILKVDGELVKCSEVKSPRSYKRQNSQPVVDKANGVFFIVQDGKCLSFAMETGTQGPTVALG